MRFLKGHSGDSGGWTGFFPYDDQFTFVRPRWETGTYGAHVTGRGINFWLRECPRTEQNLMTVLKGFTLIDAKTDGSLVLTLDEPGWFLSRW